MANHKKTLVFPKIPPKFKGPKVPKGFVNDVRGWTFSKLEVERAAKSGELLTADVDLSGKGRCSLNCGHCFRRTKIFWEEDRMDLEELKKHLQDAKKLGLKSVKLIGPGEPLEEKGILDFLRMLREMDILPLIFTKGHVLGDDALCQRLHGMSGQEMTAALHELDVSILLGATSFDAETEDAIVGRKGYHAKRNLALERIVEAGFTDFIPGQPTRLALICTPLLSSNIGGAFETYRFARSIHAQPVLAPTMIAGRALDNLSAMLPDQDEFQELYVKVNLLNIELGITTLEEIESVGVTAYAGAAPCNQIATGMYLKGWEVLRCPGDDISIQGDLREQTLAEIWENSENRRVYAGRYNNGCPPKEGKSFPEGFFDKVLEIIKQRLGR